MKQEGVPRLGPYGLALALSVALYHLSLLGVFFLLPLEWIRRRYGARPFQMASVLAAAGIVAVEAALAAAFHRSWSIWDGIAVALPLVLIAGWVLVVETERLGWRFLNRLLAVTAVTGLVLFPLVANLLSQASFQAVVEKSFTELWNQLGQASGSETPGLAGVSDRTAVLNVLKETLLGSFLLVFVALWALTDRFSRALDPAKAPQGLKSFFVPAPVTWVFLGLWAALLAQAFLVQKGVGWDWGFWQYPLLNAALITLAVHCLGGWGIVVSLLDSWAWPGWTRMALGLAVLLLVLTPGVGQVVVLGGLSVLNVLELWMNFRNRTQGEGL